jgi:hypothetical protein
MSENVSCIIPEEAQLMGFIRYLQELNVLEESSDLALWKTKRSEASTSGRSWDGRGEVRLREISFFHFGLNDLAAKRNRRLTGLSLAVPRTLSKRTG